MLIPAIIMLCIGGKIEKNSLNKRGKGCGPVIQISFVLCFLLLEGMVFCIYFWGPKMLPSVKVKARLNRISEKAGTVPGADSGYSATGSQTAEANRTVQAPASSKMDSTQGGRTLAALEGERTLILMMSRKLQEFLDGAPSDKSSTLPMERQAAEEYLPESPYVLARELEKRLSEHPELPESKKGIVTLANWQTFSKKLDEFQRELEPILSQLVEIQRAHRNLRLRIQSASDPQQMKSRLAAAQRAYTSAQRIDAEFKEARAQFEAGQRRIGGQTSMQGMKVTMSDGRVAYAHTGSTRLASAKADIQAANPINVRRRIASVAARLAPLESQSAWVRRMVEQHRRRTLIPSKVAGPELPKLLVLKATADRILRDLTALASEKL